MNHFMIGIFAGVLSAIVTLASSIAGPLAAIATFISLLPILIVTLGWHHQTGLIAALAGAIICALVGDAMTALTYLVFLGLPAWGIGYLGLLGRRTDKGMEWYPLGQLFFWMVCLAIFQQVASLLIMSGGSFETYMATFKERLAPFMQAMAAQAKSNPDSLKELDQLQSMVAGMAPAIAAQFALLMITLCVWFSARITARNNRLSRPLPDVPAMRMPFWILILVGGGFLAMWLFDGLIGLIGKAVFAAAFLSIGLQGLAALHDISRRWSQRRFVLGVVYILFLLLPPANILIALFGIADILTEIRTKFGSKGSPPSPIS